MKFLCPGCKAKYQISDQKVAGKTLKMNCRQCGEEIVIRGDAPGKPALTAPAASGGAPLPPPPPAAAGSTLGAGFREQLGSQAAPPPAQTFDEWHVAINDIPVGPMRREEVGRKITAGAVSGDSLAWREGLDDWMPVRTIPELAIMLQGTGTFAPPAPPVPQHVQPAARAPQVAPVGARMPAPPPAPEPPPPAYSTAAPSGYGSPSTQPMDNPISVVQGMPTDPSRQPNMAAMIFMALAAGAFLIMLGGWMFKMMSAPAEQAMQQPVQPPPTAAVADPEPEEEPETHVIDLDMEEISGEAEEEEEEERQAATKRATTKRATSGTTKKTTNAGGKQLSKEEQEKLARMGGGFGNTPGIKRPTSSRSGGSGSSGSGLTGAQLKSVVLKQRKNLQRCYETALRKQPSDETVRLDVEITVSPSGNVTRTSVKGNGLRGMDTCIQRSVKMWRFPSAGAPSTVGFPLLFQPGG